MNIPETNIFKFRFFNSCKNEGILGGGPDSVIKLYTMQFNLVY